MREGQGGVPRLRRMRKSSKREADPDGSKTAFAQSPLGHHAMVIRAKSVFPGDEWRKKGNGAMPMRLQRERRLLLLASWLQLRATLPGEPSTIQPPQPSSIMRSPWL